MVSTYGMHRLESVIHSERPSTAEIVARIEQAARAAHEKALASGISSSLSAAMPVVPPRKAWDDEPGLPTRPNRIYVRAQPNPQFQPSGYVNSV
jgi:hypothetical protein